MAEKETSVKLHAEDTPVVMSTGEFHMVARDGVYVSVDEHKVIPQKGTLNEVVIPTRGFNSFLGESDTTQDIASIVLRKKGIQQFATKYLVPVAAQSTYETTGPASATGLYDRMSETIIAIPGATVVEETMPAGRRRPRITILSCTPLLTGWLLDFIKNDNFAPRIYLNYETASIGAGVSQTIPGGALPSASGYTVTYSPSSASTITIGAGINQGLKIGFLASTTITVAFSVPASTKYQIMLNAILAGSSITSVYVDEYRNTTWTNVDTWTTATTLDGQLIDRTSTSTCSAVRVRLVGGAGLSSGYTVDIEWVKIAGGSTAPTWNTGETFAAAGFETAAPYVNKQILIKYPEVPFIMDTSYITLGALDAEFYDIKMLPPYSYVTKRLAGVKTYYFPAELTGILASKDNTIEITGSIATTTSCTLFRYATESITVANGSGAITFNGMTSPAVTNFKLVIVTISRTMYVYVNGVLLSSKTITDAKLASAPYFSGNDMTLAEISIQLGSKTAAQVWDEVSIRPSIRMDNQIAFYNGQTYGHEMLLDFGPNFFHCST